MVDQDQSYQANTHSFLRSRSQIFRSSTLTHSRPTLPNPALTHHKNTKSNIRQVHALQHTRTTCNQQSQRFTQRTTQILTCRHKDNPTSIQGTCLTIIAYDTLAISLIANTYIWDCQRSQIKAHELALHLYWLDFSTSEGKLIETYTPLLNINTCAVLKKQLVTLQADPTFTNILRPAHNWRQLRRQIHSS